MGDKYAYVLCVLNFMTTVKVQTKDILIDVWPLKTPNVGHHRLEHLRKNHPQMSW